MFKVNSDGSVGGEFFLSTGDGKLHNGKISPELANRIVNSKNKLSGRELLPAILENNQKKIESLLNDPNPSHNSSLGM